MTSWVGDSAETCSAAIPSVSGPETTRRLAPHRPTPSSHRSFCKLEIDFFFMGLGRGRGKSESRKERVSLAGEGSGAG